MGDEEPVEDIGAWVRVRQWMDVDTGEARQWRHAKAAPGCTGHSARREDWLGWGKGGPASAGQQRSGAGDAGTLPGSYSAGVC